jgi:hypothetical protein
VKMFKLKEILVVRTKVLKLIHLLGLVSRVKATRVCGRKVVHQPTEHREKILEGKILQLADQVNHITLTVDLLAI